MKKSILTKKVSKNKEAKAIHAYLRCLRELSKHFDLNDAIRDNLAEIYEDLADFSWLDDLTRRANYSYKLVPILRSNAISIIITENNSIDLTVADKFVMLWDLIDQFHNAEYNQRVAIANLDRQYESFRERSKHFQLAEDNPAVQSLVAYHQELKDSHDAIIHKICGEAMKAVFLLGERLTELVCGENLDKKNREELKQLNTCPYNNAFAVKAIALRRQVVPLPSYRLETFDNHIIFRDVIFQYKTKLLEDGGAIGILYVLYDSAVKRVEGLIRAHIRESIRKKDG